MKNAFFHKTYVIKFVLQALLVFIHFLYALYVWFVDRKLFWQSDPWRNRTVETHKKYRLVKIPNHLVVSVCQEEVFYEYLAKLLAWALFLDVPVISFYHNENGNAFCSAEPVILNVLGLALAHQESALRNENIP